MKQVNVGNMAVGDGNPCLISLEPSATYESLKDAVSLLELVAEAGADAVKFQTFLPGDSERILGDRKDITVEFSTKTGKKKESVFEALKRRELSKEDWKALVDSAHQNNLLFITAPYFVDTVDFLVEIKVDAIKVSKGDINNVLLIEAIAKTNLPVILDGREKFSDVLIAVEICEKAGNEQIILMHCPAGYPANDETVHLSALTAMRERLDYPVGFADHSLGDTMNYAAVAMGANILEKTITTDRTTEHVEHFMSLEPHEFQTFVRNVRSIENAMGTADVLDISRVEPNARRSLVAARSISTGEEITAELLDFRRPGDSGISCADGYSAVGKKAKEDIPKGVFLQWEMLS
jgi:N,N'-diacetyllegionaminate synthase